MVATSGAQEAPSRHAVIAIPTPVGPLRVVADDEAVRVVHFVGRGEPPLRTARDASAKACRLAQRAADELEEYFAGKRADFTVPAAPRGTPFQERVWKALGTIPFGETTSYGAIAKKIGRPTAARAIGGANNKNPAAVIVPCHRVIGADGALVGYGGGLDKKRWLLAHEARAR